MSRACEDTPFTYCDDADGRVKPGREKMKGLICLCTRRLCFSSKDLSPEKANAAVVAVYKEAELNVGTAYILIAVEPYEDRTAPEFWEPTFWQLVERLAREWLKNK